MSNILVSDLFGVKATKVSNKVSKKEIFFFIKEIAFNDVKLCKAVIQFEVMPGNVKIKNIFYFIGFC
jgi:hypothetical protein